MDITWKKRGTVFCTSNKGAIYESHIEKYKIDKIPVYPFMFHSYSRYDPSMKHLDDSQEIDNIIKTDNIIKFTKPFESHITKNIISFSEEGFSWNIEHDGISQKLNFGLVVPVNKPLFFNNEEIQNNLINYYRYKERKYNDQQYIDFPMLSFFIEDDKYSIYTPYLYSIQMFYHEQNNIPCLRISVDTKNSRELTIGYFLNKKDDKNKYLELYPSIKTTLKKWNKLYMQLENQYNINIIYSKKDYDKNLVSIYCSFDWPSEHVLEKYVKTLSDALKKYPTDFANKLNINKIVLCNNLRMNENSEIKEVEMKGAYSGDVLLIDVNSFEERHIHHEMYHSVSQDELECDIYSYLLTDYDYVDLQLKSDNIQDELVRKIKSAIVNKGVSPIWEIKRYDRTDIPSALNVFTHKDGFIDGTYKINNMINIIGSQHSGLSLLSAILNCSSEISTKPKTMYQMIIHKNKEATWDWLISYPFLHYNTFRLPGDIDEKKSKHDVSRTSHVEKSISKLIYMTRHPLSVIQSTQGPYIVSLEKWEREQMIYYTYFQHFPSEARCFIRYEDILLSKKKIKDVFDFIGMEYDDQYLSYGDFSQYPDVTSDSKSFDFGKINPELLDCSFINDHNVQTWWKNKKSQELIKRLGYDKYCIGE